MNKTKLYKKYKWLLKEYVEIINEKVVWEFMRISEETARAWERGEYELAPVEAARLQLLIEEGGGKV